jgi:hypothetical protein
MTDNERLLLVERREQWPALVISYVTKDRMQELTGDRHYFGYAFPDTGEILVRVNLPSPVRRSVLVHEQYHLDDKDFHSKSVWRRELDASLAQFKKEPIGTIILLIMSLHPSRLKLMVKRIISRK